MNAPITIEEVKEKRALGNGFLWTNKVADLAISQSETIKAQAEEIAKLTTDFNTVNAVNADLQMKIAKLKQERDEAYVVLRMVHENSQARYEGSPIKMCGHFYVCDCAREAVDRALKSEPNLHTNPDA